MNTQRILHITLFLILIFILSTPVLHAADQSVCDDGASAATQTEDLIPLPCGAGRPTLSPVGACENNVQQFEINNGCTPLTLYEKTGDGAWTSVGEVERSFSNWCDEVQPCQESAQIKIVDSQDQDSDPQMIRPGSNNDPMAWNVNPNATIAKNGSLAVSVTGGVAPYTWEVNEGFHFSCESECGASNTLYSDYNQIQACMATITVTDACSLSVTGYVKHPGGWEKRDDYSCVIPGPPTEAVVLSQYGYYSAMCLVRVAGDKKQKQVYYNIWSSSSAGTDTCPDAAAAHPPSMGECITFDCQDFKPWYPNYYGAFNWCRKDGIRCDVFDTKLEYWEWVCN